MSQAEQDRPLERASDALLAHLHTLHPQLIDLSLDRIRGLLDDLGRPQDRLAPVIHVAGTNGKGSTVAFIGAILRATGLRVHVYTSPHLVDFHERIALAQADGSTAAIGEHELVDVLERVSAVNAGRAMTFFEITTAAAFLAFSEQPADAVLLEVGLGGRLDATNLIDQPAVTVITPVSIDHADKLGETIGQIAGEKAGILKAGVPCVVAPQFDDAMEVITRKADVVGADLVAWGRDFDAHMQNGRLVFQDEERLIDLPLPGLRGPHQRINAGVAVAAARVFARRTGRAQRLSEAAIAEGLRSAEWPARMALLANSPLRDHLGANDELWLDGGHNPAAGLAIAEVLADLEEQSPKPAFLVVAMMANKDVAGFLAPFAGLARGVHAVPLPGSASGAPPEEIASAATGLGIPAVSAASVEMALRHLQATHAGEKRVLMCGSLYLAGAVLAAAQQVA